MKVLLVSVCLFSLCFSLPTSLVHSVDDDGMYTDDNRTSLINTQHQLADNQDDNVTVTAGSVADTTPDSMVETATGSVVELNSSDDAGRPTLEENTGFVHQDDDLNSTGLHTNHSLGHSNDDLYFDDDHLTRSGTNHSFVSDDDHIREDNTTRAIDTHAGTDDTVDDLPIIGNSTSDDFVEDRMMNGNSTSDDFGDDLPMHGNVSTSDDSVIAIGSTNNDTIGDDGADILLHNDSRVGKSLS